MPDLCKNCYKGIEGTVVTYEGGTYHPDCFVCSMCRNGLSGTTFQFHEGKKVCQSCFREWLAKRCGKCHQLIVGNVQFVNYEDKTFHNECFVCFRCRKPLAGLKFRVHGENRVCTGCDWVPDTAEFETLLTELLEVMFRFLLLFVWLWSFICWLPISF